MDWSSVLIGAVAGGVGAWALVMVVCILPEWWQAAVDWCASVWARRKGVS